MAVETFISLSTVVRTIQNQITGIQLKHVPAAVRNPCDRFEYYKPNSKEQFTGAVIKIHSNGA